MKILIDSREQLPYTFDDYDVQVEPGCALPTGDYSIQGFEDRVAVERKSLNDLIGCMIGDNRKRFEKELIRGRSYDVFAVIIEAEMHDIGNRMYESDIHPHSVLQSIIAFQNRYRIPFVFAIDRQWGEYYTHWTLKKYIYEIEKKFKEMEKIRRKNDEK